MAMFANFMSQTLITCLSKKSSNRDNGNCIVPSVQEVAATGQWMQNERTGTK